MEAKQRIAVIGAGPIGLEAALYGLQAGYDVQVYERGRIADNMRDWGHVRLFSIDSSTKHSSLQHCLEDA